MLWTVVESNAKKIHQNQLLKMDCPVNEFRANYFLQYPEAARVFLFVFYNHSHNSLSLTLWLILNIVFLLVTPLTRLVSLDVLFLKMGAYFYLFRNLLICLVIKVSLKTRKLHCSFQALPLDLKPWFSA